VVGLEACWSDQTTDLTRGAYLRSIREPFEMVPIRNLEILRVLCSSKKHLIRCFHAHLFARSCIFEVVRCIRILLCNSEVYNEVK
jgi:hypothetical protein